MQGRDHRDLADPGTMNDEPAKGRDARIRRLLFAMLFGGFLIWVGSGLTETISFAPGSWRIWVVARLACQAGGLALTGYLIGRAFSPSGLAPRGLGLAVGFIAGLALSLNPLRDLLEGPVAVSGRVVSEESYHRPTGTRVSTRQNSLRIVIDSGGELHRVELRDAFFDDEPAQWRRLREQRGEHPLGGYFVLLKHQAAMLSFNPPSTSGPVPAKASRPLKVKGAKRGAAGPSR